MVRSLAIVLGLLVVLGGAARADSPKLAEARRAVDEVRYDDARRLLVEAVTEGGNSPAAMRELYALSARTAIVLGQRDLGEQYYRRLLALDPAAQLPAGIAPKVREAFVAAQAHMAAHGRLAATATRRAPGEIEVVVDSDPLAMAHAIASDGAAAVRIADRRARLAASSDAVRVRVLDDRGNHLLELDVAPAPASAIEPPATHGPRFVEPPRRDRPVLQRWQTWAIPSLAFLLAGGVLGTIAIEQHDAIVEKREDSANHFFTDVDDQVTSMRRNATIGIVLGSVGAALAVPAVVYYIRGRQPWDLGGFTVLPSPRGVALSRTF